MRKFALGFLAGAATYHYATVVLERDEIKTELRDFIRSIDEKLANEQDSAKAPSTHDVVHGDEDATATPPVAE